MHPCFYFRCLKPRVLCFNATDPRKRWHLALCTVSWKLRLGDDTENINRLTTALLT